MEMTANTAQRVAVERLTELLAKATPGPWEVDVYGDVIANGEDVLHATEWGSEGGHADAYLIAEAINALPALLLQVAELESQLGFYHLCMNTAACDELRTRAFAAERAREEAFGLLREVIGELAGVGCHPCTGSMAPFEDMAGRIAAFLAANWGDKP